MTATANGVVEIVKFCVKNHVLVWMRPGMAVNCGFTE